MPDNELSSADSETLGGPVPEELESTKAPGGGVSAISHPRFGAPVSNDELDSIDAPGGGVKAISINLTGAPVAESISALGGGVGKRTVPGTGAGVIETSCAVERSWYSRRDGRRGTQY